MEASGNFPISLLMKSMLSNWEWEGEKVVEAGGKRSRWERVEWQSDSTRETERRIAWKDLSPLQVCNCEFKVSPVSIFMAFLNPLLVFQVQARNICRVAFNHVEILLEGRLLMLWFKYIFRILELEETLKVFISFGRKHISEHSFWSWVNLFPNARYIYY